VIGREGIVRRLPLALDAEERVALARSAESLNAAYERLAAHQA
jgi:hypothetical protein